MDLRTSEFYSRNVAALRICYAQANKLQWERLLRAFAGKRKVLDVGCGTGRDLSLLLREGKDAYGVDGVREMLEQAEDALQSEGLDCTGRLFQAELPDLGIFADSEFDGVLCSAVLQHLPDERIFDAVYSLRRVLKPNGVLLVSVPLTRSDVDPVSRRDDQGRLFADLPPAKLQVLLERMGFSMTRCEESSDSLGRDAVSWWTGEFHRIDEAGVRPLHLVESILNRDKKDATYKLALFRALAEIAETQSNIAAYLPEGKVKIPLATIAEKWMLYNWPLFEGDLFIPQRVNETRDGKLGVAIRKPLEALIRHFANSGGLTGFYCDWKSGCLQAEAERLFQSARSKFQSTIHTMPAKHAGGGHYDVFQYDPIDKSLCMDVALWRELCLMGSWIRDATILRWAEQTEIFAKGAVKASMVIDSLLLAPDQGRNVSDAQKHFRSLPARPCVWSQAVLRASRFDVDHAMPFSYWRNNDLWNLFPADPAVNSRKSDGLPTYRQLNKSRDIIVGYWRGLDGAMGERFQREAQTLLGRDTFTPGNWEGLLFTRFVEAFEVTAAQRAAERWEMPGLVATGVASEFVRPRPSSVRYPAGEEGLIVSGRGAEIDEPDNIVRLPFHEVGELAFRTHLPFVGSLAAGAPFHGINTGTMDDLAEFEWVEVPRVLAGKNRFVVRVAGDSMEPTLRIGDHVVFEYHRSPRRDRQIVIANIPEFGPDNAGLEAIKRISQDGSDWLFESDNAEYAPLRVCKADISHPILGIYVGKLQTGFNCHDDRRTTGGIAG